jgi:hypothetical protein
VTYRTLLAAVASGLAQTLANRSLRRTLATLAMELTPSGKCTKPLTGVLTRAPRNGDKTPRKGTTMMSLSFQNWAKNLPVCCGSFQPEKMNSACALADATSLPFGRSLASTFAKISSGGSW